jgi:hypothetical protein
MPSGNSLPGIFTIIADKPDRYSGAAHEKHVQNIGEKYFSHRGHRGHRGRITNLFEMFN